jgi:hypothetical protein
MTRRIHLWPESPRSQGDEIEVPAVLEGVRGRTRRLFFRVPSEERSNLASVADMFVLATAFHVMRAGADLEVHGAVSPSLLGNLEEFQLAWSGWRPDRYRPFSVTAGTEREEASQERGGTIMAFSGGLDSCCTAWRHTRGNLGRRKRRPGAAVMVHGFDIPLQQREVFARAAARSKIMLDSIGVRLIPMSCNVRALKDTWADSHGAALAACMHLLAGGYSTGLIAGSHTYDDLRFPWGSNPVTDPMLGSASLAIVHDGCDLTRWDKAEQIGDWPEALRCLRVCWEGEQLDRNCGRCMRCVATALCFATVGRPVPAGIPVSSPEEAVARLRSLTPTPVQLDHFENKVVTARRKGLSEPWVEALAQFTRDRRRIGTKPRFERLIAIRNELRRRRLARRPASGSRRV